MHGGPLRPPGPAPLVSIDMATGSMMHTFTVQWADMDRGVYEDFTLRVARHPSETDAYMLTRLLAYCMEYEEGIAFSEGISSTQEPAVLVRDPTGQVTVWIEVGAPDAERLHHGSKLADRVAVYTHRDPARLMATWSGKRIHRAQDLVVRSFDPDFIDSAVAAIERRNVLTLSLTESQLYLDLNQTTLQSTVHENRIE